MPFVSAKCPNCGASIQMDSQQESGFCLYCGSKIQFKEAVAKIRIDKAANLANYRELAMSAYRGNDDENALKYIEKALEINAHDTEMWFLKGRATLRMSHWIVNSDLILECVRNVVKYASDKQKMSFETNQFLYEAACEILAKTDDEDMTDTFWHDTFLNLEMSAISLIKEVPEDFTDKNGDNLRRKFADDYIAFLRLHMSKDNAYQWALAKKDRFFDLAPDSMSERDEIWKKQIVDYARESEIQTLKNHSRNSGKQGFGCFILLLIFNIFLWYYIVTTWQRILG